jgi:hypothetical protein
MVKFSEKFGLDKDRLKVEEGMRFSIIAIPKIEKTRKEGEDYEVATIDAIDENGKVIKRYASNRSIIDQCKQMLEENSKPDGTLKESVEVVVVSRISEKRKKAYLCFE